MSVFTEAEVEYLKSQRIGRLATVNDAGEPHVVPTRFRYNEEHDALDVGGHGFGTSKKFRDAAKTGKVAFVVDDSPEPRRIRGIEVRGSAEIHLDGGEEVFADADRQFVRILPTRIISWGIDGDQFTPVGRAVEK
jgi:pyridoxamine 5'-phosphate oxidase family protein